jgi:leucyl/phenylalanyl-tRNA--protein transferase
VTIYRLGQEIAFPPPDDADPSGLLAVGGDLEPERLLLAYAMGIFPWYDESQPILWHSPDPRLVLVPDDLSISRSLRRVVNRGTFDIALDRDFDAVINACALTRRKHESGTWITSDMIAAYSALFELGFAHCVEARIDGELVGGLYGVSLGGCFFGESMFQLRSDASKVAFVTLVRQLRAWDFDLIDCQVQTDHLMRFGAREWTRPQFLAALERSLQAPTRRGRWRLDLPANGSDGGHADSSSYRPEQSG